MKLSAESFRRMMADPEVPERELRAYLRIDPNRSRPFSPSVLPDPEKVEMSEGELEYESAMGFGNAFCRWRRRRAFEQRLQRGDPAPVLVSEGDSWFQFPFLIDDVIDHLGRDHLIWCSGAAGDTALNMVFTRPEYLTALDAQADRVRAFLFSAAGNDVIGEDAQGRPMLAQLVLPAEGGETADALIDRDALAAALDNIARAYREVVARIRADTRFATLPIIVHGYDYCFPAIPNDPRHPIYAATDEWLGSAFRERNVRDGNTQRAIVRILIDALYNLLFEIAQEDEAKSVHVVDARGAMPELTDWADEIHGTDAGFGRVAARFRETIDNAIGAERRSPFARFRGFETRREATVVIDPGHGGAEKVGGSSANNAAGPSGTLEKDLTLSVGLMLREELARRGHRSLMTRASDRNLGLAARAAVARDATADVFVSVHFNGWTTPAVQGTETFHQSSASRASRALAEAVQNQVRQVTGLRDRGVKSMSLGVLQPSRHDPRTACCLTEVSFLTDPAEEQRLQDRRYQSRIAIAIADGVEQYLAQAVRARPGAFELARVEAAEEEAAGPEFEDAACLAGKIEGVKPTGPRVRLSRPVDRAAIDGSAPALRLTGFTDAKRFLEGWRERTLRRRGSEAGGGFERRIGTDDTLPVAFLGKGARAAAAVCKIEASGIDFEGRPGEWVGTGFLVAPNLLLTNHHVIHDVVTARSALALFSYEMTPDEHFASRRTYRFDPDRLFLTSPAVDGLDFTFVHLEGDAHEAFGVIPINRGSFVIARGERANLIHHPDGQPKRISLRDNKSLDFDEMFLHYASDTEVGSSGAPVFDDTWRLIALHHAWETLPPDFAVSDDFPASFVNEGVKLSAITVDVESRLSMPRENASARRILDAIQGSDSLTGYFGVAGRHVADTALLPRARVEAIYRGGAQDVDIAYWNASWFAERPHERVSDVASVIADLNLDIWSLAHCPPAAAEILKRQLFEEFGQEFTLDACARSEVATFWNPMTVEGGRLDSTSGDEVAALPPCYRFRVADRTERRLEPYAFRLASLPIGAPNSGIVDSEELTVLAEMLVGAGSMEAGEDWVIAGIPFPEPLLSALEAAELRVVGAADPLEGAMLVVPREGSVVDAVFTPPTMARGLGAQASVRHAGDVESIETVRKLSGRRLLMARLSLLDEPSRAAPRPRPAAPKSAEPPASLPLSAAAREQLIREFLAWFADRGPSSTSTEHDDTQSA